MYTEIRVLAHIRTFSSAWYVALIFYTMNPIKTLCNKTLCRPFTATEVSKGLGKCTNTPPGPNGISYEDLRCAGRWAKLLTVLYNAVWCMATGPDYWCESTTILQKEQPVGRCELEADRHERHSPQTVGGTAGIWDRTMACLFHYLVLETYSQSCIQIRNPKVKEDLSWSNREFQLGGRRGNLCFD